MIDYMIKGMKKISRQLDIEFDYNPARYNFESGLPLENALQDFLKPYFPTKYGFGRGYLVDKDSSVSNQSDWIIYDKVNFCPIIAKSSDSDTFEWYPFDGAYGVVEVKRTLSKESLSNAIKQLNVTKKLKREPTTVLSIHPHKTFSPKHFGLREDQPFEATNNLYTGIYFYSIKDAEKDDFTPQKLISLLTNKSLADNVDDLPDFIAVHGQYFIKKIECLTGSKGTGWTFNSDLKKLNGFTYLETSDLTSGMLYFDLLTQFANMDVSAAYQISVNEQVMNKLKGEMKNSASLFQGMSMSTRN